MTNGQEVLANIHSQLGLANFATRTAPLVLDYAQRHHDFMGRQVAILPVIDGQNIIWFSQHGYIVTGIDASPKMLTVAHENATAQGVTFTPIQHEISKSPVNGEFDLVLSFELLNEMGSIRDVESTFQHIYAMLKPGRHFIFDLHTAEGLATTISAINGLIVDTEDVSVTGQTTFDYERQLRVERYVVYQRDGDLWRRSTATRTLRAFPIQAIHSLLKRANFEPLSTLTPDLTPYDFDTSGIPRVIIIAQKR